MDELIMGALLRTLRVEAGRSQREQADLLSDLAGRPVTRNEVSRWENEARLLTPYWQQHYAESFGVTVVELRRAVAASRAQRRRTQQTETQAARVVDTDNGLAVADEGWPTDWMSARGTAVALWSEEKLDPSMSVDGAMQTASHSVVFKWLLARRDEDINHDGAWQVTRNDVAALLAMKRSLTALDAEHGGGAALALTLTYLSSEVVPLLHGRYHERIGRELFGAAAELAFLAGWMAYDAGKHGHARRQMLHALRLSQIADNRLFGGRVLVAMSHQALHIGQIRDGIDFAAAATKGVGAVGLPVAVALFAASEARALAVSGDKQASLHLMRTAERALGRANAADGPEWLAFMDEAELAGKFGRCFRDLGMHQEAESHLDRSLSLHKAQYPRSRAITKIIHATNYARQGELEPACQLGLEALPDIGRLRSQRTKEYLTDLYRGLGSYQGEPLVQSFREQAQHLLVNGRT